MNTAIRLSVLYLLAIALVAAKEDRDWKTGTLLEQAETREVAEGTPLAYTTSVGYVIQGQGTGYTVALPVLPHTLPRDSSRPSVTIHGPIKYCYDKGRFYIEDEEGQEFEMTVMRKEVLPVAAPHRRWRVPWPLICPRSMIGSRRDRSHSVALSPLLTNRLRWSW